MHASDRNPQVKESAVKPVVHRIMMKEVGFVAQLMKRTSPSHTSEIHAVGRKEITGYRLHQGGQDAARRVETALQQVIREIARIDPVPEAITFRDCGGHRKEQATQIKIM